MKAEKIIGELKNEVGAIILKVLNPSFRKLWSQPQIIEMLSQGDAFEDTAFKPGFEIVKC